MALIAVAEGSVRENFSRLPPWDLARVFHALSRAAEAGGYWGGSPLRGLDSSNVFRCLVAQLPPLMRILIVALCPLLPLLTSALILSA